MGFFDIFKKKPTTTAITRQKPSPDQIDILYRQKRNKIQSGLSKPTASTGTPMEQLKGAARYTAELSNIGGGSKATGGGGMREGMKTVMEYSHVDGVKKVRDSLNAQQQKKLGKKR